MAKTYSGSCLCGDITFSVDDFSQKAANCYCSMCRKFHGAAYGTLVGVRALIWNSGFEKLSEYVAPNGTIRTFCTRCGSSIGFRVKGERIENMEIAIALFDDDIPVKIDAQIYTSYKASWCKLDDGVATFLEGRKE